MLWERRKVPPYRYGGNCSQCGDVIKPNDTVWVTVWDGVTPRRSLCVPCAERIDVTTTTEEG